MVTSSPNNTGTGSIWDALGIPQAPGDFSAAAGDAGNAFGTGAIDGALGELSPLLPYIAIGALILVIALA